MIYEVSHVIFDLDGLILDTEAIFENVARTIAEEHGKKHSWDLIVKIMGKSAVEGVKIILEDTSIPLSVEEYMTRTRQLCENLLPNSKVNPGVEKLIRHLKRHKIPIAVATSSSAFSIKLKTINHLELFGLFDHVISAVEHPEVRRAKPFPDVFLVCASRFPESPPPEKVLVFEDSSVGKDAAIAANMPVILVPDPRLDERLTEGATQVLKSLEDFVPEDFGLPPYDNLHPQDDATWRLKSEIEKSIIELPNV